MAKTPSKDVQKPTAKPAIKLPPVDVAPPKFAAVKLPPVDAAPANLPTPKLPPIDSAPPSILTDIKPVLNSKGKSPRTSQTTTPIGSSELSPEYADLKEELLSAFRLELQLAREDILAALRN